MPTPPTNLVLEHIIGAEFVLYNDHYQAGAEFEKRLGESQWDERGHYGDKIDEEAGAAIESMLADAESVIQEQAQKRSYEFENTLGDLLDGDFSPLKDYENDVIFYNDRTLPCGCKIEMYINLYHHFTITETSPRCM